jgi:hypothetical protein
MEPSWLVACIDRANRSAKHPPLPPPRLTLPVKFQVEVDYMVVHPDDFGQHWGVRFNITPVLPELFKGTLF